MDTRSRARALGWFSIGLGLTELLAPQAVAAFLGVGQRRGLIRACGVREIATGIGLLTQRQKGPWLWARVAGDAVDIALLVAAFRAPTAKPGALALALGSVGAVTLLDGVTGTQAAAA